MEPVEGLGEGRCGEELAHLERLKGIEANRVTAWFTKHLPDVEPPLHFRLVPGGRSNLTFEVSDRAEHRWALRRPPTAHVLPTAHDMGREYRIIAALGRHTDVPVPRALGFCDDESVTGAPFYVMGFVDGHILRDHEAALGLGEAQRRRAGEDLVDVLARLHNIDFDAIGLGDLGRRGGYLERQLKRWHAQYERSRMGQAVGLVDRAYERLLAALPPQHGTSIVHGDYRLDNAVLTAGGRVRAVLDWELCTLGDPLADVGLLLVYWIDPGDQLKTLVPSATTAGGFPRRAEVAQRYALASGRDLSAIGIYMAFGYWKLACILQGVYQRYRAGAAGGDPGGVEAYGEQVQRLAELSLAAIEGRI